MTLLPKLAPYVSRAFVTAYGACAIVLTSSAADLPVPCVAGSCGQNGPTTWVTSGNAAAVLAGNSLTINQTTQNATLNWQSFNISADGTVTFQQPDASSVALNRIWQADPSRIFGALNANGRVYLLNQNGILFGEGARVNVGGLVASALDITPEAITNGLAGAAQLGQPAFRTFDGAGAVPPGAVRVEQGAEIRAASGGQVLLFAPETVTNEGRIATPDGQTILAAGSQILLATSTDPDLRGLLVEVGTGGSVTNGATANAPVTDPTRLAGQIIAERGNVTLAGLAVNQLGRVSANTSVRSNGSVRLLARDSALLTTVDARIQPLAQRGGTLTLGENSLTSVTLDAADDSTQVDVNAQARSQVELFGTEVSLLHGSRVIATSGEVSVTAVPDPQRSPETFAAEPDSSRIFMAPDARIDVSGVHIELPMESNVVRVELRGSQLANSPLQRDGALRGQPVFVDSRLSGTRSDGTTWRGTPLADVSGDLGTVQRSLGERNLTGGTVRLVSQGDVVLSDGSAIDLSGGSIRFLDGYIKTTQLLTNGRVVDIGAADPNRAYQGIANGYVLEHPRWGVAETFAGFANTGQGRFERGYVQGHDAGSLSVIAPRAVLDGTLTAEVVAGPRQRVPSLPVPASSLYRPQDQLPLGGQLQLGLDNSQAELPNYVARDIEFASGLVLPTLSEDFTGIRVRPEMLSAGGITRVVGFANGGVSVGEDVSLAPGGEISLTGNSVGILGDIDAPAGRINLTSQHTVANSATTGGISIGGESQLTALGQWVNDGTLANEPGAQLAPRLVNGGSVSITARQGGVELADGSSIDVSAGAWRRANGTIAAGRGGSIAISATETADRQVVPFVLGAQLTAYSLANGGELSLTANDICIAIVNCSRDASALWLAPEFLQQGGFGSYQLTANRGGLEVRPDTQIRLRQQNLELTGDPSLRTSGADLRAFTRVTVLEDLVRNPTHLALTARVSPGATPFTAETFAAAPGLATGANSSIAGDVGARVSLRSNSWLTVDGTITARAGEIALTLDNSVPTSEFLPRQAIWLGASSRLDARGAARIRTNDLGRRSGDVLDGGSVSIRADRGYVLTAPGSVIDVSGTAAELDIANGNRGLFERRPIASDGGAISLIAAEGIGIGGSMLAPAGQGPGAQGGRLTVALDTSQRAAPAGDGITPVFPTGTRSLRVQSEQVPIAVAPRSAIPEFLNGIATLGADSVAAGGFTALRLSAGNVRGQSQGTNVVFSTGEVRFDGDSALSLARSIQIDAGLIASSGGEAVLAAPFVSFGQSGRQEQDLTLAPQAGAGSLRIDADLIDVIGRSALTGFADVSLASRGDIRLRGIQAQGSPLLRGELLSAADLVLRADQIYPTSLTQFDLTVSRPEGLLRVMPGAEPQDVLSAGGVLRLNAPNIEQLGSLRAPLGTISLNSEHVTLGAGSTTSTSAQGLTIPLGTVQGGFDWVYGLEDDQTLVFDGTHDAIPQQRVSLNAEDIDIQQGSVIDVSGGGDLQAYEWISGVGGTRDVLSATERPRQFAVLPGRNMPYAAYDGLEYRDSTLAPGDSVYLYGIEGLPEGEYALLPARYALLPGAYLVTMVDGYRDIAPTDHFAQLDGSTVVAGYRTIANTPFQDGRTSGFAVRAGDSVQRQARYDLARANDFFFDRAAELDLAMPRIPRDAGVLALVAGRSLGLSGELRATAAADGRGAALDISADRLRITGASDTGAVADEVRVAASAISALGAESVLIGGTRALTDEGLRLDVAAQSVTIAEGALLEAPEVVLVAREHLTIASGVVVRAAGETASSDTRLLASGDGALLRVSSGDQARVVRSAPSGVAGTLEIAAGASVQANGGAMALESTLDSVSRGELQVAGGSLNLASSRITLGEDVTTASGLVLSSADLAALDLAELVLTSRTSIDVAGDATFAVDRLSLEASGLRAIGATSVSITARDILGLSNGSNRAADAAVPIVPGASLTMDARELQLGAGAFAIQGFETATLSGSEAVRAVDMGGLLAGGTLELVAPRVTAASRTDYSIATAGALRVSAPIAAAAASAAAAEALGATLALRGQSVDIGGRVELAGGSLTAASTGSSATDGITIRDGAVIDVSGRATSFDGVSLFAHGGDVKLTSAAGSVLVDAGGTLNVSAAQAGGDAGSLTVSAALGTAQLSGSLLGGSTSGSTGGSIDVDAASIAQFAQLNQALNANGWVEHRGFRLRGAGDLVLASGSENALHARDVRLTADQGRIDVLGTIDAAAARGGIVQLSARTRISVSGTIDARASADNAAGGRIELDAGDGALLVNPGARLAVDAGPATAVHGGRGGQISYRVGRAAFGSLLDADATNDAVRLAATISGARRVTLEGLEHIDRSASASLGLADVLGDATNPLYASAAAFMQDAATYRTALGLSGDQTFSIVPGIEIVSTGDLTLSSDWDLASWRFGGEAGVLTLRAGGTLRLDASLSDGFNGLTGFILPPTPGDSWSYRLAGGADLASAYALAVGRQDALPSGAGNVELGSEFAPRTMIRTGTGNIDIAAGRDFVLGNSEAVVYTAGMRGPGTQLVMTARNLAQGGRPYPVDGGDLSIAAEGSIKGARSNQLVTDWLWRVGRPTAPNASATAWTVNFESFRQNIGALAGGNVALRAGENIENLSASIPSIGRQVGGATPALSQVEVTGGGYLDVRAGASIYGGSYYVGLGAARVDAGATMGASPADATALAPILALGDATLDVRARQDLTVETIVNPTLLPQGNSQGAASGNRASVFATYSPQSSVNLLAVSGDLRLRNDPATVAPALSSMPIGTDDQVGLKIYPPRVRAAALRGDVRIDGSLSLFPAREGNLELFADGDVIAQSPGGAVQVLLSDADPAFLPSIAAPSGGIARFVEVLNAAITPSPKLHAAVPVHQDEAGAPARIVARSGSIIMQPENQSDTSGFFLSKPARLVAGTDIRDVTLFGQNLRDSDITSVIAGRDIVYTAQRSTFGNLIESAREITLDGPGRLELVAGRQLDLQTSGGITTRGNITNPALPDGGASVSVLAGVDVTGGRDYEEFIDRYLELGMGFDSNLIAYIAARTGEEDLTAEEAQQRFEQLAQYRTDLLAYVGARSGGDSLTQAQALELFRGYSRSEQQALIDQVFYSELRLSGRTAANPGRHNQDFSRGFAAVETLFPGANPDLDAGESNSYSGDINLFFSRIYTLDDGDISLFAPGGQVNAGLASPPAAFGISKAAADLGIVAQANGSVLSFSFDDFQVNESRVFAADGGDILVWSTRGDIDAGRGAKTALSAPPPIITFDPNGSPLVTFPAALTGSGIQTLATSEGRKPGNVDLFAARGVVNAGDAGIVAGNLTIAATAVLGRDNIQVSGVAVGVPVDAGGLGASLAGASAVASSASNAATMAVDSGAKDQEPAASLANAALSWLEVFVVGLGEEQCDQKDTECLKRQGTRN